MDLRGVIGIVTALLLCACSGGSSGPREPVVETPLALPQFVFDSRVADVDGDGIADMMLFIRDSRAPGLESVATLLAKGDGSFVATPVAGGIFRASVADLDRDRKADLVSGCATPSKSVLIRLGRGDGTFGDPTAIPLALDCGDILAGDFDGDGNVDLLRFERDESATLIVRASDGTPDISTVAIHSAQAALATRLDGDGRDDVVLVNASVPGGATHVEAYLSAGRSFRLSGTAQAEGSVARFFVADTDGDGRRDLLTLNELRPTPPRFDPVPDPKPTLHRFPGGGDGSFGAATWERASPNVRAVGVGDMDGDGRADIVVLERAAGAAEDEVRILHATADGRFEEPAQPRFRGAPMGGFFIGMHVADFDGDGRPDIALVYAAGVRLIRGQ